MSIRRITRTYKELPANLLEAFKGVTVMVLEQLSKSLAITIMKNWAKQIGFETSSELLCESCSRQRQVYVRTFGSFDVFIKGAPIQFSSAKARELLALLADRRGGFLSPRIRPEKFDCDSGTTFQKGPSTQSSLRAPVR